MLLGGSLDDKRWRYWVARWTKVLSAGYGPTTRAILCKEGYGFAVDTCGGCGSWNCTLARRTFARALVFSHSFLFASFFLFGVNSLAFDSCSVLTLIFLFHFCLLLQNGWIRWLLRISVGEKGWCVSTTFFLVLLRLIFAWVL